ncbi:MAG: hypothetical protein A2050_14760 [Candidatus Rokubacteria bacterium GWA2_73_35]|nr:MAG: hypothetical protein A2050_14760 [Candidatus Rokubacteria bacterium GWA2_73_35]
MIALEVLARWAHLALSVLLVGSAGSILLAGRSDRPTALAWETRMLDACRGLAVLAFVTGVAVLMLQTALLEGRRDAALDPVALKRVLLETRGGHVWLVRHGLLLLLAAFLAVPLDVRRRLDWRAARGETVLLAAAALGAGAAAGHAAAQPGTLAAVAADGVHALAAGAWAGGLIPLALLLRRAARAEGADARPHAVRAARRFSRLALASVLALAASGALGATAQVGSVAGLVGTPYGRLLLGKLALLVPILALAALNRQRHLPGLAGEAASVGRPAMAGLARFVAGEAALVLAVVGLAAWMALTPPAAHAAPEWPFAFRLSLATLDGAPARAVRALVGSQVLALGAVAALAALVVRRGRLPLLGGALVVLGAGVAIALPPLALDAYPTTYVRPAVPYRAASIVAGAARYREHCAACHGPAGAGDGPAGLRLPRPPADLRGPRTARHTAGDLFWWITHGIPRAGMPAFGARLDAEARWDVINYVRALAAANAARGLGPAVEPGRAWLVAPDFAYAVGPTPTRTLQEHRGRRIVVLALYTLPGSRARLAQLADQYPSLAALGAEVIAVPTDAAPDALRRLGAAPRIFFPVVTEGAADIVAAYRMLAAAPHAEILIDRGGYVRAISRGDGRAAGEPNALLAEVQELNAEKVVAPAPEAHVH